MFYKGKRMMRLLLLISSFLFAAELIAKPIQQAIANPTQEHWTVGITPYLWATSMKGIVEVAHHDVHVDQSFSDVLKKLKFAWMLDMDANKGKFGLYLHSLYSITGTNKDIRMLDLSAKNNYGIFNIGGSYQILKYSWHDNQVNSLALSPYLGLRYTINNTVLHINRIALKTRQDWTDPLIGMRVDYTLNTQWLTRFSADLGGTNANRDYSFSITALLGYQQTPTRIFFIGYELLKQKYIHGTGLKRFEWAMNVYGPVIGVRFEI